MKIENCSTPKILLDFLNNGVQGIDMEVMSDKVLDDKPFFFTINIFCFAR